MWLVPLHCVTCCRCYVSLTTVSGPRQFPSQTPGQPAVPRLVPTPQKPGRSPARWTWKITSFSFNIWWDPAEKVLVQLLHWSEIQWIGWHQHTAVSLLPVITCIVIPWIHACIPSWSCFHVIYFRWLKVDGALHRCWVSVLLTQSALFCLHSVGTSVTCMNIPFRLAMTMAAGTDCGTN
jgi:hypothetical protein